MQLVRSGLLARPGSCIRAARARDDPLQARNLRGPVRVADEVPLISALELVDRVGGLERFDLLQCLYAGGRRFCGPSRQWAKPDGGEHEGYAHWEVPPL